MLMRGRVVGLCALGFAGFGQAAFGDLSPVIFRAEAISAVGDGVVEISLDEGYWDPVDGSYTYFQNDPIPVISEATGEVVATVLNIDLLLRNSPVNEVQLGFVVEAGHDSTTFHIDAPINRFLSIPAAEARGRATASFTIADMDGDFAMLVGSGPPGTGAYTASYNAAADDPGSPFTNLVYFVYAGQDSSATGSQNDPPAGYRPIGSIVRSSTVEISFEMTANDLASSTTRFVIPDRSRACPADIDADQDVDISDLVLLLPAFGTQNGDVYFLLEADVNGDDLIDLVDLTSVLSVFGTDCP
ncbi:MAG: hypothetical protein HZB38_09235 [Planctomycetes bacterium]|nr:hypothetical protein [Planctomycetota bacterium]